MLLGFSKGWITTSTVFKPTNYAYLCSYRQQSSQLTQNIFLEQQVLKLRSGAGGFEPMIALSETTVLTAPDHQSGPPGRGTYLHCRFYTSI